MTVNKSSDKNKNQQLSSRTGLKVFSGGLTILQNSSLMYLTESQEGHLCFTYFYPHFILMTRENGKNANEWMPSLICVVPEHNLVTWQASGTSGIAAHKQEGTSAPLQAASQFWLLVWGKQQPGEPCPPAEQGSWAHRGAGHLLLTSWGLFF